MRRTPFANRLDAGAQLASVLADYADQDVVVVGLPRGGVPVGRVVADALDAPLDVILVRKLGVPFQPEVAMGAIGEGGVKVVNRELIARAGIHHADVRHVEERERVELQRRAERYRQGRERVELTDRVVIIVDDGVATGSTAKVACQVASAEGAAEVVLAVPVAPQGWEEGLRSVADRLVCVTQPRNFLSVGSYYEDFSATSDEEVVACLQAGERPS